jgi:NADH-quinone oxidoreductase subunit A
MVRFGQRALEESPLVPMNSTAIVAYLALFAATGFLFLFASLLLGRFLRAQSPTPQKLETYECGEPAVGPGTVQFDLRFYVVALVFLIFEVEVALFFPPATVFGKASQLRSRGLEPIAVAAEDAGGKGVEEPQLSAPVAETYRELGVLSWALPSTNGSHREAAKAAEDASRMVRSQANILAIASMADLSVFFAVLLVGFAYVWSRGDLDWVRAVRHPVRTMRETPQQMPLD